MRECFFAAFWLIFSWLFKPNLLHGCLCSLRLNGCARQSRKLHGLQLLTLLSHTRIIKKFRQLLETQLSEVDIKGIFHWVALDLSCSIEFPHPWEIFLTLLQPFTISWDDHYLGTGEPLGGLKPWPCLRQKNPKIHTLFRKTHSIFLPYLGSTTLSHCI